MEMIIVIELIVISVLVGIKLHMEYKNNDRFKSILRRLNEVENGLEDTNKRTEKYENQYERILFFVNSLENVKVSKPPPPDSFFRKPSESSPRK